MSEEETRAALAAVALAWPGGYGWVGEHYLGAATGHIYRSCEGDNVLCGAMGWEPRPGLCPKCALIWYWEVRDE